MDPEDRITQENAQTHINSIYQEFDSSKRTNENLSGFHRDIYDQQATQVDVVSEIANDSHQKVDWRFGGN